jgi:hypothetical protein
MPTYYVSPTGNAANPGTFSQPWTLAHAFNGAGGALTSGDVVIILGGSYQLGSAPTYTGIAVTACAGVTFRGASYLPWQMPIIRGNLNVEAQGSVWRDFRLTWDFDSGRTATTQPANGTDVPRFQATFRPLARDVTKINVILHDLGGGFDSFSPSPGFQSHDCIVYNNGWIGTLRGNGHGFYMQSTATPNLPADRKVVRGLVSFCNFASNGKLGGTDENSNLIGFRYDGCTFFDPGLPVMPTYDPEPNFVCDGADTRKGHINMVNTSLWMRDSNFYDYSVAGPPLSLWLGDVNEGAHPIEVDNVRTQGRVRFGNWASADFTDNSVTMGNDSLPWMLGRAMVQLDPTPFPYSKYNWNRNRYAHAGDARIMLPASTMRNLAQWQSDTGYDASSSHIIGQFSAVEFQYVNSLFNPERTTITVWNYPGAFTVNMDVSSYLAPGNSYALYHIYDWVTNGTPTLQGTYQGVSLTVPMVSKTPPTPQAWSALPQLPNTFAVFVLLRTGGFTSNSLSGMVNGDDVNGIDVNGGEFSGSAPQAGSPSGGWFFRRRKFRSLDFIFLLGVTFYEKARQSLFNA